MTEEDEAMPADLQWAVTVDDPTMYTPFGHGFVVAAPNKQQAVREGIRLAILADPWGCGGPPPLGDVWDRNAPIGDEQGFALKQEVREQQSSDPSAVESVVFHTNACPIRTQPEGDDA